MGWVHSPFRVESWLLWVQWWILPVFLEMRSEWWVEFTQWGIIREWTFKQCMSSKGKSYDVGLAGRGREGNVMIMGENERGSVRTKHQEQWKEVGRGLGGGIHRRPLKCFKRHSVGKGGGQRLRWWWYDLNRALKISLWLQGEERFQWEVVSTRWTVWRLCEHHCEMWWWLDLVGGEDKMNPLRAAQNLKMRSSR